MPTNTQIPQIPQTRNYYQDDRPLPTLNKNASNVNAPNKMAGAHIDQYDDEYAEDFEEYWSDDEENDGNRFTLKATQKDMIDVINLYKEKLNLGTNKNFNDLEGKFH